MSALHALRVLELSESVSGEYCGKLLADFGAEIIKIEKLGGGSPVRDIGPFVPGATAGKRSVLFEYLNTNKSSVVLDITSSEGAATLSKLLGRADVVIDDHAPGWLKAVGIDPDLFQERWPGLIVCAITPYGQAAQDERRHGEDLNVFHSSGWGFHTPGGGHDAEAPLKGPGNFQPSYEAAMDAAMCIVAAFYEKLESKQGRFIDISKQAVLASRLDYVLGQWIAGDMDVSANRGALDLYGPSGIFPCKDGYIYVWMSEPTHWGAFRQLLRDPEWAREFPECWLERECTPERVASCRHHFEAWLKTEEKNSVAERAQKLGLTLVPLNTPNDLINSPQYKFRGFFAEMAHPVQGHVLYPTVPYKLSKTPTGIATLAPLMGERGDETAAAWIAFSEAHNVVEGP